MHSRPRRMTCAPSSFSRARRRPSTSGPAAQAHETAIHRVDALAARLGRMPTTAEASIATEFALDGIDELVAGFVPRRSSRLRTDEPFRMTIAPTDADAAWTVAVSDQPPVVTRAADPAAHALITGTAAALYLGSVESRGRRRRERHRGRARALAGAGPGVLELTAQLLILPNRGQTTTRPAQ